MTPKQSTLTPWKRPECYVGASWPGYLIAPVTRNRDSSILENSNWDAQWAILKPLEADVPGEAPDDCVTSPVIVSENHFLVGWVEWVAIHETNAAAIAAAEKLAERLDNYPVLDDDDNSNREWDAYGQAWKDYGRKEFLQAASPALALKDDERDALAESTDDGEDNILSWFESLIPSGEYFIPEGDGVSVNIRSALWTIERDRTQARTQVRAILAAIKTTTTKA